MSVQALGHLRVGAVLVLAAVAAMVVVVALYATGHAGLTSRWSVPSRTFHNGLNYNLVKPASCKSQAAVARQFNVTHLKQIASDRGYARFVTESDSQPVHVFLAPKGRACVVTYAQYQEVG